MPQITTFANGSRLLSNFSEFARKLEDEMRVRTYAGANVVKRAWLKRLQGSRSGRVYRVPGTQRTYIASAPGESPARLLGDHARSLNAISQRGLDGAWESLVGSDDKKAPWLEFGTGRAGAAAGQSDLPEGYAHGGSPGMAPRPSLRPALEETRTEVETILGKPLT